MNEFIRLTNEKKQRGELDDSELEKLKNTISPMLNNEQKEQYQKIDRLRDALGSRSSAPTLWVYGGGNGYSYGGACVIAMYFCGH